MNHSGIQLPAYTAECTTTNPVDNEISTADTIAKMRGLVYESLNGPRVQQAVQSIAGGLGEHKSELDIVRGCFWWVKRHVLYSTDEDLLQGPFDVKNLGTGKDLLLSPEYLLSMPQPTGDCDDFSTLLATLLKYFGLQRVCFCTVAADEIVPWMYTHVYVSVQLHDGRMFPLDCSHGPYPGWEYGQSVKTKLWLI